MLKERFWFWMLVLALVCANLLQWFAIRELQETRNRLWNTIDVHERLLEKQRAFNREYYFKNRDFKRADKDWPITFDKEKGRWN